MLIQTLCLALAWAHPGAGVDDGHFYVGGPLTSLMVEDATYSHVAKGLDVTFEITPDGKVAASGLDLKGAGWKASAKLDAKDLKFADGTLSASLSLHNTSGSALEGVRFDLVAATDTYKAKDEKGNDVLKTREATAKTDSPLYFGDLDSDESSDDTAFSVSGLAFKADTQKLTVHCVASGLSFLQSFTAYDSDLSPIGIEVDQKGRVVVADTNHDALARFNADGSGFENVGKLPGNCSYFALNPTNGEMIAGFANGHNLCCLKPNGDDLGMFQDADLPHWVYTVRFDSKGYFYTMMENVLVKYQGKKEVARVEEKAGNYPFTAYESFDIDPAGNTWITADGNLMELSPDLLKAKRIAYGPDWHLGKLTLGDNPSVRCDKLGNVYVAENKTDSEWYRISEFDSQGNFVRMFGRGGRKQPTEGSLPGQLGDRPIDLAFGPDGRVYVATGDIAHAVMVFMPF